MNAHISYDLVIPLVELLDPVWGDLDAETLGRADEWMAIRLLTSWREDVWRQTALVLDGDEAARCRYLERRARKCARRGRLILVGF